MVCDLGEDPCEPGLGIDTVELGGLNEGIGDGRGLTATFGANEQVIFTAQSQFWFILPMSGQFIVCITGGTPIWPKGPEAAYLGFWKNMRGTNWRLTG